MQSQFINFLKQNHILALATSSNEGPYICNCFYVYTDSPAPGLLFASDPSTRHGQDLLGEGRAAVAVHAAVRRVAEIQGLQLRGPVLPGPLVQKKAGVEFHPTGAGVPTPADWRRLEQQYLEAFPEAAAMHPLPLWLFRIEWLKYTDNQIAFGHKEIWQAPQ